MATAATTTIQDGGRQLTSSSRPSGVPSFMINDNPQSPSFYDSHTNMTIFQVRECPCAPGIYCHIDLNTCGVTASYPDDDDNNDVGCFARSSKKTLLRNAWPLLLLWYSTILFFLLCTEKGRNARQYMALKLCQSNLNERLVDRFLYTHGFIRINPAAAAAAAAAASDSDDDGLPPLYWPTARPVVEEREPTELVLKTRIYGVDRHDTAVNNEGSAAVDDADNSSENNNGNNGDTPPQQQHQQQAVNEDDDACCTICFSALQVGDRVGNLPCQHTFHVNCLREWLPRRNVCPLCQNDNAATPRYARENSEDEDSVIEASVIELAPMDAQQQETAPEQAARQWNARRMRIPPSFRMQPPHPTGTVPFSSRPFR